MPWTLTLELTLDCFGRRAGPSGRLPAEFQLCVDFLFCSFTLLITLRYVIVDAGSST
jgi:hypothetical protein